MRTAWAAFAKDPYNGLKQKFGWPEYNVDKATLVRLGFNNEPGTHLVIPGALDGAYSVLTA